MRESALQQTKRSRDSAYERTCKSCVRRVLEFFLTTPDEQGHFLFHDMLKLTPSGAALLRHCEQAERPGTVGTPPRLGQSWGLLAEDYKKLAAEPAVNSSTGEKRNTQRTRKQDVWLDTNICVDHVAFCTKSGCEKYKLFLHSLTNHGRPLTAEGQKAYWKGLRHYFQSIGYHPPTEHSVRILAIHKQASKVDAQNRKDGVLPPTRGGDSIPLDLHDFIAQLLFKRGGKKDIKCLLVMQLAFSMFWPINKVIGINLNGNHVSWSEDALRIWLVGSQANNAGKGKDHAHLYANHKHPEKCVITVLGLYLMLHDAEISSWLVSGGKDSRRLSVGAANASRENKACASEFLHYLRTQIFVLPDFKAFVESRGYQGIRITGRSWVKAAELFATSGASVSCDTNAIKERMQCSGKHGGLNGICSNDALRRDQCVVACIGMHWLYHFCEFH